MIGVEIAPGELSAAFFADSLLCRVPKYTPLFSTKEATGVLASKQRLD
jgi:hypothetical protein